MKKTGIAAIIASGFAFLIHSGIPTWYHKYKNPQVIRETAEDHTIMLTFDDGPDSRYTGELLDLLAFHQIHAVFFTVICQAKEQQALLERMLAEGHIVGFHSGDHQNAMFRSYWHTKKDFKEGKVFLSNIGVPTIYYRPPWGHSNLFTWHFIKKYNMKMILWSVMAEDWSKDATVESIAVKCMQRVKGRSIICLHDAGEKSGGSAGAPRKTLKALEIILPKLKAKGYHFILPEEM